MAAACVIAAASACGSSKSKSNDDGSDAEMTCFGNAPIAGMDSADCSTSSSNTTKPANTANTSKPAGSNSTPGTSSNKPVNNAPRDSGVAKEDGDDGGSSETSSDTSSDDEWVDAVVTLVKMAGRANCDPLKRDSKLDTAARQLANDRDAMPDVGAKYHWYAADADELDRALGILRPLIVDNAPACTWRRYGVGIIGEPGDARRVVVMLAE
jgi:hypothetical protein